MSEDYVKQHIVPKRYLDRFATSNNGKFIIGVGMEKQGKTKLFPAATDKIGYIKNYYDVTDKEDPKYWEHYFANTVDSLCGTRLQNFISGVMLSSNNAIAISEEDKDFLARIIMAQIFRIPTGFEHIHKLYPAVKERLISKIQDIYDDCWPSDEAVVRMEKILKEAGYPYRYKATVYQNGSHLLCGDLSDSPKYLKSMKNILQAEYTDQEACNQARRDSMKEALEFLEGWN